MDTQFRHYLAESLKQNSVAISDNWLQRLKDVVFEDAWDIFPTDTYLDHIPSMIDEIGAILETDDEQLALTNSIISRKAMQLGKLRYEQNASVAQLLREYDILAGLLESFIAEKTLEWEHSVPPIDCIEVISITGKVVRGILQTTVDTFVENYLQEIQDQTDKLVSFNSFVSHELRTPLQGALMNVGLVMETREIGDEDIGNLLAAQSSIEQAAAMLKNMQELVQRSNARPADSMVTQDVDVSALARDIATELQETLDDREVTLNIDDDIGSASVELAKLKLVLANLLSNAIKYSDPSKSECYVNIAKGPNSDEESLEVIVEDNGLGIENDRQSDVFGLRVRAHGQHDDTHNVDGHGIGLYLVSEAVQDIDGSIALDSTMGEGTTFTLTIPRERLQTN